MIQTFRGVTVDVVVGDVLFLLLLLLLRARKHVKCR